MKKSIFALTFVLTFLAVGPALAESAAFESAFQTMMTQNFSIFSPLSVGDMKAIVEAHDSAAAYFVDGEVDAQLARAIAVLDEKAEGMADASIEFKAAKILELTAQ